MTGQHSWNRAVRLRWWQKRLRVLVGASQTPDPDPEIYRDADVTFKRGAAGEKRPRTLKLGTSIFRTWLSGFLFSLLGMKILKRRDRRNTLHESPWEERAMVGRSLTTSTVSGFWQTMFNFARWNYRKLEGERRSSFSKKGGKVEFWKIQTIHFILILVLRKALSSSLMN